MQPGEFNLEGHQVYPDRGPTLHGICTDLCSVDSTTNIGNCHNSVVRAYRFRRNEFLAPAPRPMPRPHGRQHGRPFSPYRAVFERCSSTRLCDCVLRLLYLLTTYAERRGAGGSRTPGVDPILQLSDPRMDPIVVQNFPRDGAAARLGSRLRTAIRVGVTSAVRP